MSRQWFYLLTLLELQIEPYCFISCFFTYYILDIFPSLSFKTLCNIPIHEYHYANLFHMYKYLHCFQSFLLALKVNKTQKYISRLHTTLYGISLSLKQPCVCPWLSIHLGNSDLAMLRI